MFRSERFHLVTSKMGAVIFAVLVAAACGDSPVTVDQPTVVHLNDLSVSLGTFERCLPPHTNTAQHPPSIRGRRTVIRTAIFSEATVSAEAYSDGSFGGSVSLKSVHEPFRLFDKVLHPRNGRIAFGFPSSDPRYRDDALKLIEVVDRHGC